MTIEDIEAREKAAPLSESEIEQWRRLLTSYHFPRTTKTEIRWKQKLRALATIDALLAQLKDRDEKLEAMEGALAHDKAPHMGLWFKIDRILKGGE